MVTAIDPLLRDQLLHRRRALEKSIAEAPDATGFVQLLQQVDQALERVDHGSFGLCQVCHEAIEPERLAADPLICVCLDHLSPADQRALERDLELSREIQGALLPKPDCSVAGWEMFYHYQPAGLVSGDYCDIVVAGEQGLYFMLGDVSGKGIAAAMLMANLHAMFRALILGGLPLKQLVSQANRAFCETTLASHYATLVCGRATPSGELEICNAGHLPPLLFHQNQVAEITTAGLPLGMFCNQEFPTTRAQLQAGDVLLLYTDGLTEAENSSATPYGAERVSAMLAAHSASAPRALVTACVQDLAAFRGRTLMRDDLTMMAVRRSEAQ